MRLLRLTHNHALVKLIGFPLNVLEIIMNLRAMNQSQFYGTFLASLSAVLYGLMAYFGTRLLQNDFAFANMLFWRFAMATLWMLACTVVMQKRFPNHVSNSLLIQTFVVAGIVYAAASALYFLAMTYIGTGLATAIFFSFPVFVAMFSCIFSRSSLNVYTIIALLCICIGVMLVKGHNASDVGVQGTMIAILGAFFYAIYIYRSRNISTVIGPHYLTLLVCFGTMMVFFIYACATKQLALPVGREWFFVSAIGILATALPIQFLLASLKYITPIKVSILASLRVVVTMLIGWAVLNEQITILQFLGVATILFATVITQKTD